MGLISGTNAYDYESIVSDVLLMNLICTIILYNRTSIYVQYFQKFNKNCCTLPLT